MNDQPQAYATATQSKEQVTPLQGVLNEHSEQIDKLSSLMTSLEDRLHTIRNSVPATENAVADPQRGGSMVVSQISAHTGYIYNLQRRILSLLDELEI